MSVAYASLFGFGVMPDTSGNAFFDPFNVNIATNRRHNILEIKDSGTKVGVDGSLIVPDIATIVTVDLLIYWAINVATGNIQFNLDYRSIGDAEGSDQATWQESKNTGVITVPGTAKVLKLTTLALTAANFAVEDLVEFLFSRDSSVDTAAATVAVHWAGLRFKNV